MGELIDSSQEFGSKKYDDLIAKFRSIRADHAGGRLTKENMDSEVMKLITSAQSDGFSTEEIIIAALSIADHDISHQKI